MKRLFSEIIKLSTIPGLTKSDLCISSKALTRNKGKFDNTIPIDNVVFDFEMMPNDNYRMPPKDGVYVHGLFIEGCRWNKDIMLLDESYPKVLFSHAPVIWYKPVKKEDLSYYPNYNCPVYKTGDRRGVLSTTGHSTNFISFIRMPSDKSEEHWVKRGVCMLTQLNE